MTEMMDRLTDAQLAMIVQGVLWGSGGLLLILGFYVLFAPRFALAGMGLGVLDTTGAVEARAQYGGGLIGPGAAIAAAGFAPAFWLPALIGVLALIGGLAAARAFGLMVTGDRSALMRVFLFVEFVWMAAAGGGVAVALRLTGGV